MYFSTALLLLLIFKFVQLQPPISPPTDNKIPFGYKYTKVTENFIKAATMEFKIITSKTLKMYVSDFIHMRLAELPLVQKSDGKFNFF